ncbi:MAG: aminotransferase class I/II-fold pyridoxal phosphate-dependent enzyme [Vicinamibacterales bacterium]
MQRALRRTTRTTCRRRGSRKLLALAEKMRTKNGILIGSPDEVQVTNGGTHAIYAAMHAVIEPGVTKSSSLIRSGRRRWRSCWRRAACRCRWRPGGGGGGILEEVARAITPKTKALYINSPNNPAGGILTRADPSTWPAWRASTTCGDVFSDEA